MRLRSTAPPRALPAVKPTREPPPEAARKITVRLAEECRSPSWYTRSNSARLRSRNEGGNLRSTTLDTAAGRLLPEAGADRDPLAAAGPAARQHLASALRLHALAEAVRLRTVAPVGLECALRHVRLRSSPETIEYTGAAERAATRPSAERFSAADGRGSALSHFPSVPPCLPW